MSNDILYIVVKEGLSVKPDSIILIGKCIGGTQKFIKKLKDRENLKLYVAEKINIEDFLKERGKPQK